MLGNQQKSAGHVAETLPCRGAPFSVIIYYCLLTTIKHSFSQWYCYPKPIVDLWDRCIPLALRAAISLCCYCGKDDFWNFFSGFSSIVMWSSMVKIPFLFWSSSCAERLCWPCSMVAWDAQAVNVGDALCCTWGLVQKERMESHWVLRCKKCDFTPAMNAGRATTCVTWENEGSVKFI